jgi:hypothetical protein
MMYKNKRIRVVAESRLKSFIVSVFILFVCAQQANAEWPNSIDGSLTTTSTYPQNVYMQQIGVDLDGNTIVAGSFTNEITLGDTTLTAVGVMNFFIAKYSPAGEVIWAKATALGAAGATMNKMVVDDNGDIFIQGELETSASEVSIGTIQITVTKNRSVIFKITSEGLIEWAETNYIDALTDYEGMGVSKSGDRMFVDGSEIIFLPIGGVYFVNIIYLKDKDNLLIAKVPLSVEFNTGFQFDVLKVTAINDNSFVVNGRANFNTTVCGTALTTGDDFIARYNPAVDPTTGDVTVSCQGDAVAVEVVNKLISNGTNVFLLESPPGSLERSVKRITRGGIVNSVTVKSSSPVRGMDVDEADNVYISGGYDERVDFGSGADLISLPDPDPKVQNVYVAKLKADLSWDWVNIAEQTDANADESWSDSGAPSVIALSETGFLHVAGNYIGTMEFGTGSVSTTVTEINSSGSPTTNNGYLTLMDSNGGNWLSPVDYSTGQVIPKPAGTTDAKPIIELNGEALTNESQYFYWNSQEAMLYAVSPAPGIVTIKWIIDDGSPPQSQTFITNVVNVVWPVPDPQSVLQQTYIEGSTVRLENAHSDLDPTQLLKFDLVQYPPDVNNLLVSAANPALGKVFRWGSEHNVNTDFVVLRYTNETTGDTVLQQVEKKDGNLDSTWNSSLSGCVIGTPLEVGHHNVAAVGRNGYMPNSLSRFDASLHNISTGIGPIIPVNRSTSASDRLDVIWYSINFIGQYWADTAVRYTCEWPTVTDTITISDQEDTVELGPEVTEASIYHQPDLTMPGYNPNEEHAMILDNKVYALRDDLNAIVKDESVAEGAGSDAYVLLKYLNSVTSLWTYKIYNVVRESIAKPWPIDQAAIMGNAAFTQEVGKRVTAPKPLLIGSCTDELSTSDQSPANSAFIDHKGAYWASAEGSASFQYFYPLQDNFHYDLDSDGDLDKQPGDCVAWLNRYVASNNNFPDNSESSDPIKVAFNFTWPRKAPILRPGETLFTYKPADCAAGPNVSAVDIVNEECFLPAINGQAAVQIIFDETNQSSVNVADSLVKLIDPLSARHVPLDVLTSDISTIAAQGKKIFSQLPFVLRSRLSYDEVNKQLSFKGTLNGVGPPSDPQLLPNIMTELERVRIRALGGADSNFKAAVDALYHKTRNPSDLSLETVNDFLADEEYLIGLQAKQELWAIDENNDGFADNFVDITDDNDNSTSGPDYKDDRLNDEGFVLPVGWKTVNTDDKSVAETQALLGTPMALTAGRPSGTGYVTLVFNNDKSLGSLSVDLKVIKIGGVETTLANGSVSCDVYQGNIWIVPSDNIFEEKLTLRHTGDFAGDPDNIKFEWWYQPDDAGQPAAPTGNPLDNGWQRFPLGSSSSVAGQLDITLENTDAASALLVLSDNWFITRYTGLGACNNGNDGNDGNNDSVPSAWAGDPSQPPLAPKAMLGVGWIKRVISGLNPFDARVSNFHESETNTLTSIIAQAGEPYRGPIPLNPDPDNVNNIGIIEAYQTIFERGMELSINQGTNSIAANTQLLNVSTRISDLYMLLGNEAYADAQDPTIGFDTGSEVGSIASSIFTFQNQLNSTLEEELVLLRGRDDSRAGIAGHPVYNRLLWNFTQGTGEVAYVQSYGIGDQNSDGFITETDARIRYPQGHGDAWGHYLTSVKNRYQLLRENNFTWVPRAESVTIGSNPIEIDYQDERKFAAAAAAKAKAGAEIVNLTYREKYVEAPTGQWQGYKDTDETRDWGVDGGGRRAGQGAYFDWAMANAILPAVDPDPTNTGIGKIDRTTVVELAQIVSGFNAVQAKIDQSDAGLNPLGLAKGVVPFDIDPSFLAVGSGTQGQNHFDQIAARAQVALDNAIRVFDHANQQTQSLRNVQDDVDQLDRLVIEQELDYKNQLIEIFGYPYAGDLGGGGSYPSDYDGPDILHSSYVNSDLTGDLPPPDGSFDGFFNKAAFGGESGFFFPGDSVLAAAQNVSETITVNYPTASGADWPFIAPKQWRQRRATGEIQLAISDLLQAQAQLQRALTEHGNLLQDVEDAADLINAEFDLQEESIAILQTQLDNVTTLTAGLAIAKAAQLSSESSAGIVRAVGDTITESIPKSVGLASDVFSVVRGGSKAAVEGVAQVFDITANIAEFTEFTLNEVKDNSTFLVDLDLTKDTTNVALIERIKVLEQLWRQEAVLRLELYTQNEVVKQSNGRYSEILARGQRLLDERATFRTLTAGDTQQLRYQDMTFRIFRNDALQKYRASFDLAARYVYLTAAAYDYETNLLGSDAGSGRAFYEDIVRQRSLGQVIDGVPVAGTPGLADVLARLTQNFDVYRGQLGFNNPQVEQNRFSLRNELFRLSDDDTSWQSALENARVDNLWDVPEFRRFVRPFTVESQGKQPGLVIRFPTTVTFGLNFFGHQLGGGDSAYDPTNFATKVRAVGAWFSDYDGAALSNTPRVYLVPVGMDVLRSPSGDDFTTREWRVVDQKLPAPFPIGASDLSDPNWIARNDSLSDSYGDIRRMSSFRAYHDSGEYDPTQSISDSRLIGRSVWNTQWMLIIPGGTLQFDPEEGLNRFIHGQLTPDGLSRDGQGISDILLHFQTYGFSGN